MTRYFAMFNVNGDPQGFYPSDVWPDPPAGAVEITQSQWQEFIANPGARRWHDGAVIPFDPPPPQPQPRIIYKADIWRRASNAEADTMDAMLDSQPARLRRMWADAQYLQSDDELYATIEAALTAQFGATRAAELLA